MGKKIEVAFIIFGIGFFDGIYGGDTVLIGNIAEVPQIDSMIRFDNENEHFNSTELYKNLCSYLHEGIEADYQKDYLFRVKNVYYEYLDNLIKITIFADYHNMDNVWGDSAKEIDNARSTQ